MIRLKNLLKEGMGLEEKLFAKHMRQQLKIHQKALDNHTIQMAKYWIGDLKDFTVPQLIVSLNKGSKLAGIVAAALKSSGLDKKYGKYLNESNKRA